MARVVITAPSGWPFPMGFPRVTTSGLAPWTANAHQSGAPTRPNPVWTSSAMASAPRARAMAKARARNVGGRDDLSGRTWERLGDERAGWVAVRGGLAKGRLDVLRVGRSRRGRRRSAVPPASAVGVGKRCDMDVRRPTVATGTGELVRADVDEPAGVAVVGAVEGRHITPAGRRPGQPQRELVRLRAASS